MSWPQKIPPRVLTRGQSFLHNKMGFSDRVCISVDASKNIPKSGVLGRPQYVEANSGMYSPTRIRPYLKILKYIWWDDRCWLVPAALQQYCQSTAIKPPWKYSKDPIKLTQAAVWRLGSSGKAIKAKSNLDLRPLLNQWQERTKIQLRIEGRWISHCDKLE